MNTNRSKSRCKARTKAGKPCGAAATGGGLCFFHANPKKASELGRIGGRRKRQTASTSVDALPRVDTATAVRDTVARVITDIHEGRLQPGVAAGLASLLNLQLRAIEVADLERRLASLEMTAKERVAVEQGPLPDSVKSY